MSQERTEKPTRRRLKELRRKGTYLHSPELAAAAGLVALAYTLPMLFAALWNTSISILQRDLLAAGHATPTEAIALLESSAGQLASAVAAPVAVVLAATMVTNLALSRGRLNTAALKPRAAALSPKVGFRRLFGTQGLIEAGKGTVKLAAVAAFSAGVLTTAYQQLTDGPASVEGFGAILGASASALLSRVVAVAVAVGLVDFLIARRRYNKSAKMTKAELKAEYKADEGDPMVKAARRARAAQLARGRMIEAVADATVVVVNPTHIAIALRYRDGDIAPKVVARGAGVLADKIRARAAEAGVPVRRDVPTARALYRGCRVGDLIPPELYLAVAAILAAVMNRRVAAR